MAEREEYVPTTDEIREAAVETGGYSPWFPPTPERDAKRGVAFDRWLAEHDREVAADALRDAATYMGTHPVLRVERAHGAIEFSGDREFFRLWLRQRARELRKGASRG